MRRTNAAVAIPLARLSRRELLAHLGPYALAMGLAVPRATRSAAESSTATEAAWRDLKTRLSGPLLRPAERGYAELVQPNNLRYAHILPAGVARCRTAEDVRQAVLWARNNGVPIAAKSGGHSYAGHCMSRGLMVEMTAMDEVTLSPSTGIMRIGGGARNAALYGQLKQANAAITHGRCMAVGAAAFLLGGGIGFNMRQYGLACDQMLETEIVTADGEIRVVNEIDHPDLLWACRGAGGGNLGINTAFKLQTFSIGDRVVFAIEWEAKAEELVVTLLESLEGAPDRLGCKVLVPAVSPRDRAAGRRLTVRLLGQLDGSTDELMDILKPVYRVAEPHASKIARLPYWDAQTFLAEEGKPGYYQERSLFLAGAPDARTVAQAMARAMAFPGTSASGGFKLFQTGGLVNRLKPEETAFVHRRSSWLLSIELDWTAADSADAVSRSLEWQAAFYDDLCGMGGQGAYQNFPDPALEDWQSAYYGANLDRLRAIKARYDPDFLFRFPQAIVPA